MSRIDAAHLLADTIDTNAIHADADARRRAELEAALHPERAAMRANSERRRAANAPQTTPSPEPKKEDPMPPDTAEVRYCPTPGCGKKLRRDNTKGKCGYCSAGVKKHLKPVGTTAAPADDEILMGESAVPVKKALRKSAPPKQPKAEVRFDSSLGVAKLRMVAEALGFNADAVLDELAGEWLTKVGNQVREAADA